MHKSQEPAPRRTSSDYTLAVFNRVLSGWPRLKAFESAGEVDDEFRAPNDARRTRSRDADAAGAEPEAGEFRSPRHKVTTGGFSGVVIAGTFLVIAFVGDLLLVTKPTVILSPYSTAGRPPGTASQGSTPKAPTSG
ncbi:hypothetical protein [Mycobacterium tilburgii]|uniref:hypothetical protein n=1 Tax=Mycobacterium tilburgii TaxID=44467 RepID=UPI0011835F2B|nr:hypothetical protein [Mycobacterium tilburgii]